eukprot:Skav203323  [mRNA]  locus=scaffold284:178149:188566:- [translate_table: standard]
MLLETHGPIVGIPQILRHSPDRNNQLLVSLELPDGHEGGEPSSLLWFNFNLRNLVEVMPVILLAYATQSSAPIILASLKDDSWQNVRRITGFVSVCLYAISATFGHSVYLRYSDTTTNNALTTIGQRPVDNAARWSGFVLVCISYIFVLFPIRNVLMSACLGKDELEREAPYYVFAVP